MPNTMISQTKSHLKVNLYLGLNISEDSFVHHVSNCNVEAIAWSEKSISSSKAQN